MSAGAGEFRTFSHPAPARERRRIRPVFLPFAGCPHRCLFCDQKTQTGTPPAPLEAIRETLEQDLRQAREQGDAPFELGLFGGTFTALPGDWPERFLQTIQPFRAAGLVLGVRCSTRPDAVDPARLRVLKSLGLDLVELGVQSFDDAALAASGRGYDGSVARAACRNVREAGLGLGIQLLPGLPGDRPGVFRSDVETAARLTPDCARLYPCLVLEGTELAALWRAGAYTPWSLARARAELSLALSRFWRAAVPVIRLGLAPEPGLSARVLAGPAHPALGQEARSLALLDHVRRQIACLGRAPGRLEVPVAGQGEFWGQNSRLERAYARLGLPRERVGASPDGLFRLR